MIGRKFYYEERERVLAYLLAALRESSSTYGMHDLRLYGLFGREHVRIFFKPDSPSDYTVDVTGKYGIEFVAAVVDGVREAIRKENEDVEGREDLDIDGPSLYGPDSPGRELRPLA